jgi:hypothetical protein
VIEDLRRPHLFASERMGFLCCRAAESQTGIMVLAESYNGIADDHYIEDFSVGARIDGNAIRSALQTSLEKSAGLFHVHMHEHKGAPFPSKTDLDDGKKLIPDFFNVTPSMPHGMLILSEDSASGLCWLRKTLEPRVFDRIEFVGSPYRIVDRYA